MKSFMIARGIFAVCVLIALFGIFSGTIPVIMNLVLIALGSLATVFMANKPGDAAKQQPHA